jgi:hypothetical protein
MPIPAGLKHLVSIDDATFDRAPVVIQIAHIKSAHQQLSNYIQALRNFYNHLLTLPTTQNIARQYVSASPIFSAVLMAASILHKDDIQCLYDIIYISGITHEYVIHTTKFSTYPLRTYKVPTYAILFQVGFILISTDGIQYIYTPCNHHLDCIGLTWRANRNHIRRSITDPSLYMVP